jgi:hypothetical protein
MKVQGSRQTGRNVIVWGCGLTLWRNDLGACATKIQSDTQDQFERLDDLNADIPLQRLWRDN